ncbi:MAG: DnaJ domain-containing protein [Flavobacteriaceae bacterium]
MKLEDAAKILEITGELNKKIIKRAYKKACKKYHPDKGGSEEMMKAVNQAYDALKDFEGSVDSGDSEYSEKFNDILNQIVNLPGLIIEICGAWIWVTGDTKEHKDVLGKNGLGFYWASKKKAWYYRPADWKSKSRGTWDLDKIRATHGSSTVKGGYQKRLVV